MEENLRQISSKAIKIVLYGPESTGKTTLAKQLADHFNTEWVPEYAREYLQEKWNLKQEICTPEDLLPIAKGQVRLENEKTLKTQEILFSDTNLLTTMVYSQIYYGFCDPKLSEAALKHSYDLYLLTDIDVPWELDDLRDRPHDREKMMAAFRQSLADHGKPYILLSGSGKERLEKAIMIVEDLQKILKTGLKSADFIQIYNQGIPVDRVLEQWQYFKKGLHKVTLERPATLKDGILNLTEDQFRLYAAFFDDNRQGLILEKFVPASGAASRMFQFLIEFLQNFNPEDQTLNAYINKNQAKNLETFLVGLDKFPFYESVLEYVKKQITQYQNLSRDARYYFFIEALLSEAGFNFGNKPKGVLPFHKYDDRVVTALEEHLAEAASYTVNNGQANIHFTVSEEHRSYFEQVLSECLLQVEQKYGVKINVNFSYQDPSTNTLAVDSQNTPFRLSNGELFFRPGGHGALISNLNKLKADIVFIKNIDNVVHNHKEIITSYKKALAGILLYTREKIYKYLGDLERDCQLMDEAKLEEIIVFLREEMSFNVSREYEKFAKEHKVAYLHDLLNRPLRVCGMVKNEGEPGGGPFWVRNQHGEVSLQIVEAAQIDTENPRQVTVLKDATHFNPVDVVCSLKNHKGDYFDLNHFIDPGSGFIVEKTKDGMPIRAYELPGLWNGAMAKWNTIFVEVPLVTFNPVKTINDLLKPNHQPYT